MVFLFLGIAQNSYAQPNNNDSKLANHYYNKGEFDKAEVYYLKLYKQYKSKQFFEKYFDCLVYQEKYDEAEREIKKQIKKDFGSFDQFKNLYLSASKSVEGSGWGILAYQPYADKLVVLQAEKHQNQSQWISYPILVVDVWEHAYYLKYQNKRGAYVNAFFEVINWEDVSKRLEDLKNAFA